ncbi:MAG: hypothetical protein ACYS6W_14640 [Planctomycetota bacterium]|jgi:hypothetical protein
MPPVATNKYQKTLGKDDFFTADVKIPTGAWTLVGEYTVPAQQEIAWGATEIIQGGATGMPAYIRFDDTGGSQLKANCKIKLVVADANDQGQNVAEFSATQWSASATPSRTASLLLHEDPRRAVEDSKLQIWIYATEDSSALAISSLVNAQAVLDYSDSDTDLFIPITVWTIRR